MCMEDIVIGRRAQCRYREVAVALSTVVTLVEENTKRIALQFGSPSATGASVFPTGSGQGQAAGFPVNLQSGAFQVDLEKYGRCVTDTWSALGGSANSIVSILETFLE